MTTRDWLNRGWVLNQEVNELLDKQQMAFAKACNATTTLQQDKVQTSMSNSMESKMIRYADYEQEINRKIDELYQAKREILSAIRQVDNTTYKILLHERYIKFNCWEKVAKRIKKSCINTRTSIHKAALKAITQYVVQF